MPSATDLSSLPTQYDHRLTEERWYQHWLDQGYFHAEAADSRPPFSLVIPPPNVTGALHLGHALNNTLQDIIARLKRMQGFNVLWMPGTDHAGIATQAVVERRLKDQDDLTRHDLGREKLVERIWEWKCQYEGRILGQLRQLGASCDWDRTRFTLDETCARAVRHTFFRWFEQGRIYRGKKLVNWDTFLQTAVSDDEVFHTVVEGHFWHFRYPVIDPAPGEPEFVEIATTRPETMLGDTAVACHPDPAAALDKATAELEEKLAAVPGKEKSAVEEQLTALAARREKMLPQLELLRDMANAGRKVRLPLLDREIPLIADEWAKPELGTGCVKITPAHDPNDYEVGKRHPEIGAINILRPDGTLNENAGPYEGLTIKQARKQVVEDLEAAELLGDVEDREIDLAHSDRSKTPIEPYLADQWFVQMDELAQLAIDAVEDGRVAITPARYAKGYLDWLGEKRDWPIGRQLWWGHRIPIWSKEVENAEQGEQRRSQVETKLGSENAGLAMRIVDFSDEDSQRKRILICLRDEDVAAERALDSLGFAQEEDVLDTWFSSALWPHSTLGWPEQTAELERFYPTNVLITSRDIITLWVARMVLAGLSNTGKIPFHQVYIHPKILDGYGETMSKSKGNGVDPLDVIEKFGADALRFGIAYLTTETQDVRMPVEFECPHCGALIKQTKKNRQLPRIECDKCAEAFKTQWATNAEDQALARGAVVSERFELGRNFANKLWNAARFSLMNLEGYSAAPVEVSRLDLPDRWLLSRLSTVTEQVTQALETFRYAEAARALYDFAWDDFCSFYVEMSKPRLADAATRPVAQRVLAHGLDTLMRLLHPMMPFLSEEIWHLLGEVAPQRGLPEPKAPAESVAIAAWPTALAEHQTPEIEAQFAEFQAVLGAIREVRSRQNIPPREKVEFAVRCDSDLVNLLEPMEPLFHSMAGATASAWGPEAQAAEFAASVSLGRMDVHVDIRRFMDVEAEMARLDKELARLDNQIGGIEKKLASPNFVERAPAEVVERERTRLIDFQQQRQSTETARNKIQSME